jgi:shikimate dehydrogenase
MPVSQSKGVYVHNALFGSPSRVYTRFPVKDVRKFMRIAGPWLSGCSVTIPHKSAVMGSLDGIDSPARAMGAVNTVVREGNRLIGSNTDAPAALDAIEQRGSVRGRTVVIIGYGGSARAIAFEAARRGGMVVVAGRNEHRARALARAIGVRHAAIEELRALQPDILVNATPVGMVPNVKRIPAPLDGMRPAVVMDAVFNPPLTEFLKAARRTGAATISGTEMYVRQGAMQSALWTNRRPDLSRMRRILAGVLK